MKNDLILKEVSDLLASFKEQQSLKKKRECEIIRFDVFRRSPTVIDVRVIDYAYRNTPFREGRLDRIWRLFCRLSPEAQKQVDAGSIILVTSVESKRDPASVEFSKKYKASK